MSASALPASKSNWKSPQAIETVRAVEGALGKLANQLYEGDARTRDTLKDVRSDMVGLSHRLAQIELRDPERVARRYRQGRHPSGPASGNGRSPDRVL